MKKKLKFNTKLAQKTAKLYINRYIGLKSILLGENLIPCMNKIIKNVEVKNADSSIFFVDLKQDGITYTHMDSTKFHLNN